ncbi:MAG: glycosyl hydrolase 43 family protein [Clostridiales bacterium]|nr:glycosyl hydrolase 43 family protein [Clostridiales bacterium]
MGQNPLTGMDFPDVDVIRVGDTYYMISTTMYFMPGGVILRSYDLINWEYCTRIYDVLDDTPRQRLEEGNAYGAGMWAATLRWHKGTFYVIFVANDTRKTYLFRAENIEGPWRRSLIDGFYHDCSLLFDDDDRVYLTYGNKEIRLIELNAELTGPKEGGLNRVIADYGDSDYLGYEGSHLYKINGNYYLFLIHSRKDRWRRVETCLMSDSLTGEFRGGIVMDDDMGLRDDGVAQGGIVDTPDGRWYAILFQDTGAAGRIPVLMTMTWENGFPVLGIDGKIPLTVCSLTTRPGYLYAPLWAGDDFTSPVLKNVWEWNHIPRLDLVQMGEGALRLRTGAVSPSLTRTRNILTQRAMLPGCQAEVELDASALRDGDIAGLCVLQSRWGFIGLKKEKGAYVLIVRTRCEGDPEEGVERAAMNWPLPRVRLRAEMRFGPDCDTAAFAYWTEDGWKAMGEVHPIAFLLDHFTGNRFGLFAQSLIQSGGEAAFRNFVLEPQE